MPRLERMRPMARVSKRATRRRTLLTAIRPARPSAARRATTTRRYNATGGARNTPTRTTNSRAQTRTPTATAPRVVLTPSQSLNVRAAPLAATARVPTQKPTVSAESSRGNRKDRRQRRQGQEAGRKQEQYTDER